MIQIDIPMPKGCDECPLNYDFCWCRGVEAGDNRDNEWPKDFDFTKRPGWCPLKDQPEIVRCKDCKYNNPFGCMKLQIIVGDDWFCADGERRTDDA